MTDADATSAKYWAEHLRKPVRFSTAVETIWNEDATRILIELGPRKTLATLAMQHAEDRKKQTAIPSLSSHSDDDEEWKSNAYSGRFVVVGWCRRALEQADDCSWPKDSIANVSV